MDRHHLFKAIVLPKIMYALSVYGAINFYDLLDKCDRRLFIKIKSNVDYQLYALLPEVKESPKRLRSQASLLPRINTERFEKSYFNRIAFKYNSAI